MTRHPLIWGLAIWGAAHVLVSPGPRMLIFAGLLIFLLLAGSATRDVASRREKAVTKRDDRVLQRDGALPLESGSRKRDKGIAPPVWRMEPASGRGCKG